jgi:four helix bundle protein
MANIMNYLSLKDLSSYNIAFDLSNYVWDIVIKWDYFAKDTVGKQFVRSVDSISANIAEGFGRYYKKDKILFYRYSYGSIQESISWIEKAKVRKLVNTEQYKNISNQLEKLPKEVNSLIRFTNEKLKV